LILGFSWLLTWLGLPRWIGLLVWLAFVEVGYQLRGSVGKRFIGLSLPVRNRFQFYQREIAGKTASLAIFGIGFLMILSRERLALHDYMAKTRVFQVRYVGFLRRASAFLLAGLGGVATTAYFLQPLQIANHFSLIPEAGEMFSLASIVKHMPAVATLYVYNTQGKPIAQGSGFLITDDGVGVTNYHVIKDAFSGEARLGDGRIFHILSVHAYKENYDIAIFQLGRKTSAGLERATDLPHLVLSHEDFGPHFAGFVGQPRVQSEGRGRGDCDLSIYGGPKSQFRHPGKRGFFD